MGAYVLAQHAARKELSPIHGPMLAAARLMATATAAIRECRVEQQVELSPDDVNATGLIGVLFSPLTTTVGDLGAKRTSTNPNVAAILVQLLSQAGAKQGDAVAIGASGSFPALVLASLAAAYALELRPVLICSLGASQWGANDPRFTWLAMEECLVRKGIFPDGYRAVAVSLGGDRDVALELEGEVRDQLFATIAASGTPLIYQPNLQDNVAERLRIYNAHAEGRRIAAFIGIGGAWADLGESPTALHLLPGLNPAATGPPELGDGVTLQMLRRGIPVIHLLNLRGLAARYGLPWDPSPLPAAGRGAPFTTAAGKHNPTFLLVAGLYLGLVAAWSLVVLVRPAARPTLPHRTMEPL